MKRQKIKRYSFHCAQGAVRKKASAGKAAGAVLLGLCLIAAAGFGVGRLLRAGRTGWKGTGMHRTYVSQADGTQVHGLYEIDQELYYFGSNGFAKVGWINEDGFVGYADQDGRLARGETTLNGKSYYFQPETGQLYTGWVTLDGVDYCFDETGHPRTGVYQENGVTWQLDANGAVQQRLSGWRDGNGSLCYYKEDGSPAQGWLQIDGKDYFFVDGVSRAGWVETDEGLWYLDGSGSRMTGWCVIDGQPYALDAQGAPKQGWDHSHAKNYYFVDGVSQSGTVQEGQARYTLNGSGSIEPAAEEVPEEDLADDAEGEPPTEEELLDEKQPEEQTPQVSAPEMEAVPQPAEESTTQEPEPVPEPSAETVQNDL